MHTSTSTEAGSTGQVYRYAGFRGRAGERNSAPVRGEIGIAPALGKTEGPASPVPLRMDRGQGVMDSRVDLA